jgi:ketosteroid isomerase-like protein
MSQENVDLIRSVYDAANRRDFDFLASTVTGEFEIGSAVTGLTYRSADAFRYLFAELGEAFGEFRMLIEETVDAGDHVVVVFRVEAIGRGSGLPVTQGAVQVWTFRDGRLVRCDSYLDRQQALEAAGLRE